VELHELACLRLFKSYVGRRHRHLRVVHVLARPLQTRGRIGFGSRARVFLSLFLTALTAVASAFTVMLHSRRLHQLVYFVQVLCVSTSPFRALRPYVAKLQFAPEHPILGVLWHPEARNVVQMFAVVIVPVLFQLCVQAIGHKAAHVNSADLSASVQPPSGGDNPHPQPCSTCNNSNSNSNSSRPTCAGHTCTVNPH
jgi:hypothetical protein